MEVLVTSPQSTVIKCRQSTNSCTSSQTRACHIPERQEGKCEVVMEINKEQSALLGIREKHVFLPAFTPIQVPTRHRDNKA